VIDPEEKEAWPLHEGIEGKVVANGITATIRRSFLSVFHPSGKICFTSDSTRRLSALPSRSRSATLLTIGRSKDKNRQINSN